MCHLSDLVKRFLHSLFGREETQPIRHISEEVAYRVIDTRRGGIDMPKRQHCPLGHGMKKRTGKTAAGAYYWCNVCPTEFFVRHPSVIIRIKE